MGPCPHEHSASADIALEHFTGCVLYLDHPARSLKLFIQHVNGLSVIILIPDHMRDQRYLHVGIPDDIL